MKLFDIETDGFLQDLTVTHCAWVFDTDTQIYTCYNSQNNGQKSIEDFLANTSTGDLLAHYGIGFDYLAIRKLYPNWKPTGKLYDSVLLSKLLWPNLKEQDFVRLRKRGGHLFPARLCGSHSLEAWGYRLGIYKGDFGKTADWSVWTQDMEDYCKQDVVVTNALWELIERKACSPRAIELEHDFAHIIKRQEQFGIKFDEKKAAKLEGVLSMRKAEVFDELQEFFPPWEHIIDPCFIPKVNNKARGYVKGVPTVKRKQVTFNATSRSHIGQRLTAVYGWEPKAFNENDGKPTIDESIISALPYPPAPLLNEYLMLTKRLAMLSVGKQAWLKRVVDGRIHGRVDTLGAVTGRCTHSNPNVAQVPAVRAIYGAECRELFTVDKGYKMVGADASGLELRCLAHYMAAYDEGAYAEEVVNGDVHWNNLVDIGAAEGLRVMSNALHSIARDKGKTWMYAYLYGCGIDVSGENYIAAYTAFHGVKPKGSIQKLGKDSRARLKSQLPALAALERDVKAKASRTKTLKGLDGRILHVRSAHSALNTLLQSAGAFLMKRALVELELLLQQAGLKNSYQRPVRPDYEFVNNVHDEYELQVLEKHVDIVMGFAEEAMTTAGQYFNFRCLIEGEAKVGLTWKDVH